MLKIKLAKRTETAAKHKEIYDLRKKTTSAFKDTIYLSDGWSNEHPIPIEIRNAAKEAIERGCKYRMFGLPELKRAIADKLEKENGLEVDPEGELLVTTGGSEAIYLTILTLIDSGDEVIMADPGYISGYEPNVLMAGGRMTYVPTKEERKFKVDPEDVEKLITSKTKMIVIISPNNPTGAIFDRSDLEGIADIAVRNDLVVLSDEIFEHLIYDGKKNLSIGSFSGMEDRTITINGFAKGYNLAGYRVGYVAGPETIIEKMSDIQLHMTVSVNEVGQVAALAALKGSNEWIKKAVREYEARRNLFVEELNKIEGIRCLKPEGGFAAFPNIEAFGMSSEAFSNYLLREAHILPQSGQTFFGIRSEGYVKMAFTRPRQVLEEALARIKGALEKA